jgi:Domain of unknown function (DUF4145)
LPERVEPKFASDSFSCPHCGAHAHQSWYRLGMVSFERDEKPVLYWNFQDNLSSTAEIQDDRQRKQAIAFFERLEKNVLTYRPKAHSSNWMFVNFHVSHCYSCDAFTVWVEDKIVYPVSQSVVEPHEMMPASVKADFEEAGSIVNLSPRGAAALARLCIQKLVKELGEKGKDLNYEIGELVKKGLSQDVQQALDVVRVIGNNAVHPGELDLKDDKPTALALLRLVNMIVERCIAERAQLDELYEGLPPRALQGIEKRDKPQDKG